MPNLVMTKTPLRISFSGGGTDLPGYYEEYESGAVVSAAITKYIYVTVSNHFHKDEIRVSYSKTENAIKNIDDIAHPAVRAALKYLDIKSGIQITSITEIPSNGTGLGSSSSFMVGLLNALHVWQGDMIGPKKLAEEAVYLEREVLKEAGGRQDQYIAAFGGIQLMEFHKGGSVNLTSLHLSKVQATSLERHMRLEYTGKERSSTSIHINQSSQIHEHIDAYHKMRDLALESANFIKSSNFAALGGAMHENWVLKKSLAGGISDKRIDEWYESAMKAGAFGGKILGAGGGGFMLFVADPKDHERIQAALGGMKKEEFSIEPFGSRVIHVED